MFFIYHQILFIQIYLKITYFLLLYLINHSPIIRNYRLFIISYPSYWGQCSNSFESFFLTLWPDSECPRITSQTNYLPLIPGFPGGLSENLFFPNKCDLCPERNAGHVTFCCLLYISVSFNAHNRPRRQISLSPFVRWRSWASESLGLFSKITQSLWDLSSALPCSKSCFLASFSLLSGLGTPLNSPVCTGACCLSSWFCFPTVPHTHKF